MRTRTVARAAAAGLLVLPLLVWSVCFATPVLAAGGHGGLVSSDPRPGSSVTIAPLFVRLDFGHDLLDLGVAVRVTGPTGAVVSAGAPRLYPTTVTQALSGALPAGRYQVSWRVTADDGRPVSGSFAFSADEATRAAEAPAALPAATSRPAPVADPSAGSLGAGAELGAALVLIAAFAAAVVLLARRTRSRDRVR